MSITKLCAAAVILFGLVLIMGCSDGKQPVSGTVTLDGKPVASGTITFSKENGELIREGAVIRDGRFEALVPPGKYKIELNGQKVIGTRTQKGFDGKDEVLEITEELFPERFNAKTELNKEITAKENVIELDLKSK